MRECKFRAWCAKHKRWLCGYEMPHLGGFSLFGEVMMLGEWSHILDRFIFQRDGDIVESSSQIECGEPDAAALGRDAAGEPSAYQHV
jgi:hypothetical protein